MEEIREVTDTVKSAIANRLGKGALPVLEFIATFYTGSPIQVKGSLSPRDIAAHALDSIKSAGRTAQYYAYMFGNKLYL